jgi:hypothetical protein
MGKMYLPYHSRYDPSLSLNKSWALFVVVTKAHNLKIFLGRIGVGFEVGLEVG